MPAPQVPVDRSGALQPAFRFAPGYLAWLARAYEMSVAGMMNLAIEQIEIGQSLVLDGMADANVLMRAQTPVAFTEAAFQILERRSRHSAAVSAKMVRDLERIWAANREDRLLPRRVG